MQDPAPESKPLSPAELADLVDQADARSPLSPRSLQSHLSRRQWLRAGTVAGLGMFATGCATRGGRLSSGQRPGIDWPDVNINANRAGSPLGNAQTASSRPIRTPTTTSAIVSGSGQIPVMPRSVWAKASPIGSRLNPMQGVSSITLHHEGGTPVWFTDFRSTASRLEAIRKGHLRRLAAGDIGYHFVIDRAGRVWQGRSLAIQGAHVKDYNPHNMGIMVLGNFNQQHPTNAQLGTLTKTLRYFMANYRIPVSRVHTHRELGKTSCPGTNLQTKVNIMRSGRALA